LKHSKHISRDRMPTDEHSTAERKPSATEALGTLAKRARLTFSVPPNKEQLLAPLTEANARLSKPFAEIGLAFRANISGLISTVSVPYTLASKSASDSSWQRIVTAERIRSLPIGNEPEPEEPERREREAFSRAESKMKSFIGSTEGREVLIRGTLGFLDSLRSDEAVIGAANELIRQGVVLCWGTFEVFARDCFIAHLNATPTRTLALLGDSVARRRFELSKVSLETLAAHNFNLSDRMGTLLSQQQDLSDVYSVKSVYQALFPDDKTLSDALSDTDLRLLSLRRNLIVHHCGVIDEMYVAAGSCREQVVGDRLKVSPDNLEGHIGTIIKVATSILNAVSAAA
jgi:hypothetical protein